jgi:hypothetical protein
MMRLHEEITMPPSLFKILEKPLSREFITLKISGSIKYIVTVLLGTIFADGHHCGGDYFDMPMKNFGKFGSTAHFS